MESLVLNVVGKGYCFKEVYQPIIEKNPKATWDLSQSSGSRMKWKTKVLRSHYGCWVKAVPRMRCISTSAAWTALDGKDASLAFSRSTCRPHNWRMPRKTPDRFTWAGSCALLSYRVRMTKERFPLKTVHFSRRLVFIHFSIVSLWSTLPNQPFLNIIENGITCAKSYEKQEISATETHSAISDQKQTIASGLILHQHRLVI